MMKKRQVKQVVNMQNTAGHPGLLLCLVMALSLIPTVAFGDKGGSTPKLSPISITVTKEWDDDNNSLNKRPDSVTVKLLKDGEETGKTLTLYKDNWTGSFTDVPADGVYTVSEDPVPGYTSKVIKSSESVVTVGALKEVDQCNFLAFKTNGANLVIAKPTANDGYVVWTVTELTDYQQDTLRELVKSQCNNNAGKDVSFISGDNATHTSKQGTAAFTSEELTFDKENVWSKFWYGTVSESEGFTIVNTLNIEEGELIPATLKIKKVDAGDSTPLSGAKFTLTNEDGTFNNTQETDANGTCTFTGLTEGTYTLTETEAPEDYVKPSTSWTVTVEETKDIQEVPDATGAVVGYKEVTTCTVSMDNVFNDNYGVFIIPNTKEPAPYTVTLSIQKIVDKKVGSDNPGETKFTFVATKYDEQTEKTTQYGLETITTKGVGTYNGKLTIKVPANLFTDGNDSILLQVSEVKGTDSKWSYDNTVYRVLIYVQDSEVKYIVNPQIALRATAVQEPDPTTLTFTNTYSYKYTPARRPTTPAKPVTSVQTGDMGVALYAGLAILSMTGSAGVILRRRKNDK